MPQKSLLIENMPALATIKSARLPEVYQGAKSALAECAKVDQCQDWANKAEALASYARQAGDEELRRMADRIQARAILRCGQLLKEIEKAQGKHWQSKRDGTDSSISRTSAAREAGLSERQQVTAIRVASIPEREFEEAIESENPPTVTALADRGKQSRPKPITDLEGIDPEDFAAATPLIGLVLEFKKSSASIDLQTAMRGMKAFEKRQVLSDAKICAAWLNKLIIIMEVE